MHYSELQELDIINKSDLPIRIETIENITHEVYGNFLCINEKIPIRITKINSIMNGNNHIELLDENRNSLGLVFLFSQDEIQLINAFSEWKFITYIFEVEKRKFMEDEQYKFQYDYLLVHKNYLNEYLEKYYETSPIWGGYYHKEDSLSAPYTVTQSEITAISGLGYPTVYHQENSVRTLIQPYPFERFLKKYHHLELLFDHILVKKIQGLGDDLKGIGLLMKTYNNKEIDRLLSVMSEKCIGNGIDKICNLLNVVDSYKPTAKKIFFEYGKDNDPLDNNYDYLNEILHEPGGFNEVNCKKVLKNKAKNREQFEKFIIKLSAYWIYRIRCSIAHYKIGEYILDLSEEDFVAEFAEPLIDEVIIQVFKADI